MIRIAIERSIPYIQGLAEAFAEVFYLDSQDFTQERLQDVDALLIRSITRCGAHNLQGTSVRFIATATAGFDHIDTEYCRQAGIAYANAPGCNATAVGMWVVACLSHLTLNEDYELQGRTIGIIGVGHVGGEVLRFTKALGIRPLLYDPPRAEREGAEGFASLEQIQQEADIITLHVPLSKDGKHLTHGMVDDAFIDRLERKPILINACRGGVTRTDSLIRAVKEERVSHLLIDCWEGEPHISRELLDLTTIATPHIAGFSAEGKFRGARMALRAILEYFSIKVDRDLFDTSVLGKPQREHIDLNNEIFDGIRPYSALLHTFNPLAPDELLAHAPEQFEALRKGYDHPREMSAYTIYGASNSDAEVLRQLDFHVM